MPELEELYRFIQRLFLLWQCHKWSRAARKALRNYDRRSAQIAIDNYEELKNQL